MALNHFAAAVIYILFGGAEWVIISYVIKRLANIFITHWHVYAGLPHVTFILAFIQWGAFIMILIPTGIYLWTQTQRPEVG